MGQPPNAGMKLAWCGGGWKGAHLDTATVHSAETRNPKQIQIPNAPMLETRWCALVLIISLLVLGICFGLRIWDFGFRASVGGGSLKMRSVITQSSRRRPEGRDIGLNG